MLEEPEPLDRGFSKSQWQLPEVVNRWSWGAANPFGFSRQRASAQSAERSASCRGRNQSQPTHTNQIYTHATHNPVKEVREIRPRPKQRVGSWRTMMGVDLREALTQPSAQPSPFQPPLVCVMQCQKPDLRGYPLGKAQKIRAIYKWSHLFKTGIFSNKENALVLEWKEKSPRFIITMLLAQLETNQGLIEWS